MRNLAEIFGLTESFAPEPYRDTAWGWVIEFAILATFAVTACIAIGQGVGTGPAV